jgi:hypothetical protein
MTQLTIAQAGLTPSWPASISEILQIFGPLNDKEFRAVTNLIYLGGGIVNRKFDFPNTIYKKINQELQTNQIQFNVRSQKWISNNEPYTEYRVNEKKNLLLTNWNGSTYGTGKNSLYILIDNRCIYDLVMEKNTKHFIKIGKTNQKLSSRLKDLNTGNPYGIRPILTIKLDEPYSAEKKLHSDLKIYNVVSKYVNNQEWFYLDSETLLKSLEEIF